MPVPQPFLLRPDDLLAVDTLRFYQLLARNAGLWDTAKEAGQAAQSFTKVWHHARLPGTPQQDARDSGWYWREPHQDIFHGPHTRMTDAMAEAYENDVEHIELQQMRPVPLRYDIADADDFLVRNEDADFEETAHVPPAVAWELKYLIGLLVRGWVEKHGLAREFRALEPVPGSRLFTRPRCDLALAAISQRGAP